MIASARGLAVLAAIAVALLVASLVAGPRQHAAVDRALVTGFDEKKVAAIELSWGETGARVQRVGDGWRIDDKTAADPATLDAVFTALRGARWHRHAKRSDIEAGRHEHGLPRIRAGDVEVAIGPKLAGTDQTWVFRGGDAYLVDDWVANALVPGPLALRVRHPIDCASAPTIAATTAASTVRIQGNRLVEPRALWLADDKLAALRDACARVEIVALDGRPDGRRGLHVVATGELTETGRCADARQTYIEATSTRGCVDTEALRALADTIDALAREPQDAIDLRPLPIEPRKLTLPGGAVVDVTATPQVAGQDADPERVRELVRALRTPGDGAVPRPANPPSATIRAVDSAATEVTLELFERAGAGAPGHLIARAGEPAAIRVRDADWATLTRPAAALRDPIRWREDATTISAIALDRVTYKRGAVLGEWTREPAGTVDPALVDALAETLATVRAPTAAPPAAIVHRLRVTITPPAGTPTTHALELGAPTGQGCPARIDGQPVLAPLPLCTAAFALASSR